MPSLTVTIDEARYRKLAALARRERRTIKQQAVFMFTQTLDSIPDLPPEEMLPTRRRKEPVAV